MRLEFFGDSYDIVKRALIQWLAPLGQWHVQPLFTDDVSQQQATAFARFLGARLIEPFQARTPAECKAALDGCKGVGNLLVDPDVGVSLPRPGKPVKRTHLSAATLHEIAVSNPGQVIMSYDQALHREAPEESLRAKVAWLSDRETPAFAFRSHASFIFCSNSADRVEDATRLLLAGGLPDLRLIRARRLS